MIHIANWHLHEGRTVDEIARDFDLTPADIYAALAYFFDHREAIDRREEEDLRFADELRKKSQSNLKADSSQRAKTARAVARPIARKAGRNGRGSRHASTH